MSSVTGQPAQRVSACSTLLAREATKTETGVRAGRDAEVEVETVLVAPGNPVQAKDLLVGLRMPAWKQ